MATRLGATRSLDFAEEYAGLAERFAVTAAHTNPTRPVPGCPGWTAYDLTVHLGNTHAWAATVVETGRRAPPQDDRPKSHRPREVSRWYAGKAEDLYQVLRTCDPDAETWNFSTTPRVAAFWPRRQTHEVLVHLVDLHQVLGWAPYLPVALAEDAVGEVLEVFLPRMHQRGHPVALEAPLVLAATDTGREWVLRPRPGGPPEVEAWSGEGGAGEAQSGEGPGEGRSGEAPSGATRPDAPVVDRVEAPAEVLLPLLWKRLPPTTPELRVSGDRARVLAFLASRLTA